jgi:hypothetical protein
MGFTRSTTETEVHQGMPDYPSGEGITTAELKEAFDAPATGLKSDLNGLMSELENALAAGRIGANAITEADDSAGNIQAKLEKIYTEMQSIALGDIPDNTITEAKLTSTFSTSIAKKNGSLQNNLNAEFLGGKDLAYILGEILAKSYSVGTFTTSGTALTNWEVTINVGFNPTALIYMITSGQSSSREPGIGIVIGTKHTYYEINNKQIQRKTAVVENNQVKITEFYGGLTYSYIAFR